MAERPELAIWMHCLGSRNIGDHRGLLSSTIYRDAFTVIGLPVQGD